MGHCDPKAVRAGKPWYMQVNEPGFCGDRYDIQVRARGGNWSTILPNLSESQKHCHWPPNGYPNYDKRLLKNGAVEAQV